MKRSNIFTVGIAIIILTIIIVLMAILQLYSSRSQQNKQTTNRVEYSTFSNTSPEQNTYKIFNRPKNKTQAQKYFKPNIENIIKNTPNEQTQTVQSIIQGWKAGDYSNDAQATRAPLGVKPKSQTTNKSESEDLIALFKKLVGPNMSDALSKQNKPFTKQNNNTIWLGTYKNNQPFKTNNEQEQTIAQIALYKYGNNLGALLTSFNITQGDQTNLLADFIKNRKDTKALKKLSNGYIQLSTEIKNIPTPKQLETINSGLVSSYKSVGELLWALSFAKNDKEFIQSILAYNKSSAEVAKYQVSLITILKANGIKFKNGDSGKIFSFNPASNTSL